MDQFRENKAAEKLRNREMEDTGDSVQLEKIDEQIKHISKMSSLIKKLSDTTIDKETYEKSTKAGNEKLDESLERIYQVRQSVGVDKGISSDISKASLDMLEQIAKDSKNASYTEQKTLQHELKKMGEFIQETGANKEEIQILLQVRDSIQEGVSKNKSLLNEMGDKLGDTLTSKALPAMAGIVAGVFADSPIVGIAAGLVSKATQEIWSRRQEKLKARRQLAQLRLDALTEEHARKTNELLESEKTESTQEERQPDDDKEFTKMESFLSNLIESISEEIAKGFGEFVDGFVSEVGEVMPPEMISSVEHNVSGGDMDFVAKDNEGVLNNIHNEIKSVNRNIVRIIKASKRGKEEARRESAFEREELLSAISGIGGSKAKDDDKMSIGSKLLENLGLTDILASVTAVFYTIKKTAGKVLKGAKRLLAPLIGVFAAFEGVSDAIDVFKNTGSYKDAAIAGVQGAADGIISTLSFGFLNLDKTTAFLKDVIPRDVSDAVFRSVDWVVDSISTGFNWATDKLSGLIDIIKAPFKAISYFFETSWSDMFSDVSDFMTDLKESIFQWIASVIPDVVPDALIPNAILKYTNPEVAVEVAQDELDTFQREGIESGQAGSEAFKIQSMKLRKQVFEAELKALEAREDTPQNSHAIGKTKHKIERMAENIEIAKISGIDSLKQQSKDRYMLSQGLTPDGKDFFRKMPPSPRSLQANESTLDSTLLEKNDMTKIGRIIQNDKKSIEESKSIGSEKTNNVAVSNQSNVTHNNSSTHINKEVYNSDPSQMVPLLN